MGNVFKEDGDYQRVGGGGGYGGYGGGDGGFGSGIWAILLVVIVLWLLFKDGHKDGGNYGGNYGMPYPYPPYAPNYGGGNCCSPLDCKIPMAPDMSNCEVDKDLWKIDAHMEKCCCETQKEILEDGGKTRALIEANYIQDLRDKLSEKASEVNALKTQQYTDSKFDALNATLYKIDNQNDKAIACLAGSIKDIKCNLDCFPKLPPVYFEGITPNTHHTDCRHDDFPKRRGFDNCGCDCNCCN